VHFQRNPGTIPPARLLRTRAAAAYLGVSPWKIRRLVQDGHLPYVSDSDRSGWRFDVHDLDRYVEANKRSY
jgi:excisionase family DNA binding protein